MSQDQQILELFKAYSDNNQLTREQKLGLIQSLGYNSWQDLVDNGNKDRIISRLNELINNDYRTYEVELSGSIYHITRPINPTSVSQMSFGIKSRN
jgi:hypothetical protein